MNTKERAEIWKEYFDKLLYTEDPKKLIKIGNREINEFEVEELTIDDVKKTMRNLEKLTRRLELVEYIHTYRVLHFVQRASYNDSW